MHRLGDGTKIENLEAAKADWLAKDQTKTTFCSKTEWDATTEDFGELVETFEDGDEIRQHATVKATSRGGSCKIVHNCVIVGNQRDQQTKGCPQWTYYPAHDLPNLVKGQRRAEEFNKHAKTCTHKSPQIRYEPEDRTHPYRCCCGFVLTEQV